VVPMTLPLALAVLCGIGLGLGVWSLASLAPPLRGPRLLLRVAPAVVDVSPEARRLLARRPADPLPVLGFLLAPIAEAGRTLLDRVLGGGETIERRLRQSGSGLDLRGYRSQQLLGVVGGAVGGALLGVLLLTTAGASPLLPFGLSPLGAVVALLLREQLLARAARQRLDRLAEELPTTLEFLTLSLSAGEGVLDALRRLARVGRGELAAEFSRALAEHATGRPLGEALLELSARLRLPALERCIDQLVVALERGTPLIEVLRAHADDARELGKRELLEAAGRKEVAMLVPLVFLILPITVVFAMFPGLAVLQMGF